MAHVGEFHRWTTALNVKLLLPPRQSRGASLGRLAVDEVYSSELDQSAKSGINSVTRHFGTARAICQLGATAICPTQIERSFRDHQEVQKGARVEWVIATAFDDCRAGA
jgi:hypothetical protein